MLSHSLVEKHVGIGGEDLVPIYLLDRLIGGEVPFQSFRAAIELSSVTNEMTRRVVAQVDDHRIECVLVTHWLGG